MVEKCHLFEASFDKKCSLIGAKSSASPMYVFVSRREQEKKKKVVERP